MGKKIRLNQQGYEDYLKEIMAKQKQLAALRMYKGSEDIVHADKLQENQAFYQIQLEEQALMKEIAEMKHKLQNEVEIVENLGDDSLIDINDVVKIDMTFSDNSKEEGLFKLVATIPALNVDAEINEVSINSPLGNAMYHKKIGDVASYKVNDQIFTIELKEKITNLEKDKKVLKR